MEASKRWWKKMENYGSVGSGLLKIVEAVGGVRWKHLKLWQQLGLDGSIAHDCLGPSHLSSSRSRSSPTVVFSGCPRRKLIPSQIYWEEKGEHFWSKPNRKILLDNNLLIWSSHSSDVNIIYKLPTIQVQHTFPKGTWTRWTFPTTPEWICMKYFRFGVIVVTDRVDSKSRGRAGEKGGIMQEFEVTFPPSLNSFYPNAT